MRWRLLAVLVLSSSCEPKPGVSHRPAARDTSFANSITPAPPARPSAAEMSVAATQAASDSFQAAAKAIAALDSQIATGPHDRSTPERLFRLAQLKEQLIGLMYHTEQGYPDAPYLTSHDSDYFWDEVGGGILYTGRDWQRIVDEFPTNPVADTAGWNLAHMARGGECEEDFWCYYNGGTSHLFEFLRHFPTSSYAPRGEHELVENLTLVLDSLPQELKQAEDSGSVPATADSVIAKFEASMALLDPSVRRVLVPVTDSLRRRFGLKPANH